MNANTIQTIDVNELKQRMDQDTNLCLIDVREDYEWQEARIPGAIHIQKDELPAKIASRVKDLNQPVYLHCKGGVRSLYAAERLAEMGYKQLYSIDGGILSWIEQGYAVIR
ncbi:rhodanese-like domain-containing protein [Legionella dresdenensis]|uniref:Rhodanese-like domain-containing protein n=1 Tax=Legionella dresdenensis TaxID=450200 RepID=A0ABV8CE38_9GAMM